MKEVMKTFKIKDVFLVIRIATVCRNVQVLIFLRKKVREELFISVLADRQQKPGYTCIISLLYKSGRIYF